MAKAISGSVFGPVDIDSYNLARCGESVVECKDDRQSGCVSHIVANPGAQGWNAGKNA